MSYTPTEWESTDVVTATRMNALEQAVGDMNMSYTPNTWSDGDILSADKMNALEQAVASGGGGSSAEPLVINETWDSVESYYVLDKTFGEIREAFDNGTPCIIINETSLQEYGQSYHDFVYSVSYDLNPYGEFATGSIVTVNTAFTASSETKTLDSLDAAYPMAS